MLTTINRDKQIERAERYLNPKETRKPTTPADRAPRLYNTPPRQSFRWCGFGQPTPRQLPPGTHPDSELLLAAKALIGAMLETTPSEKRPGREEMRDFMRHLSICIGEAPGKLSLAEYSKMLLIYDRITALASGDLRAQVVKMDELVNAYQPQSH